MVPETKDLLHSQKDWAVAISLQMNSRWDRSRLLIWKGKCKGSRNVCGHKLLCAAEPWIMEQGKEKHVFLEGILCFDPKMTNSCARQGF